MSEQRTPEYAQVREDIISALLATRLRHRGMDPALVSEPEFRDHFSDAADEVLSVVREALQPVRAIHDRTHWCFDEDEQDSVYEPGTEWWPCPTLAALELSLPPAGSGD